MNHFEQIPSSSEPIQEAPDGRTGPIDRTGDSSEHARLEVEREAERTAAGLKAARNTISTVIRTARPTRHYKDVFGPEVTETQEPILDLGAGDSNFAEVVN
ncbi:hypothetical protein KGQ71_02190, partial [Patescibacteria group bacterium]|nr:hypothetical protein [Patescibacteria group bacterium]